MWNCFIFSQISLISGLIKESWILISASAFGLLQYIALVEVCEKRSSSRGYVGGKGRSILIAFSDNYGYSFLILQQNLTSSRFLKVSCRMVPETIWIKFNILLHEKLLLMQGFVTLYISYLENIGSLDYSDLPYVDMLYYTVSKNHSHYYHVQSYL